VPGRICERAVIIDALGCAGGDLLTFTADAGVVTARRDPGGMGLSLDDLTAAPSNRPPVPTFAEYVPAVAAKGRRLPSTRRALDDARLAEINQVAATTGDDPELDALILRLHTETAYRRSGALAIRPQDLDREQCLVLRREKGETFRCQPVSPTLTAGLVRHAGERRAPSNGTRLPTPTPAPGSQPGPVRLRGPVVPRSRRVRQHRPVPPGASFPVPRTREASRHP
jgi:hypothetical protein